ACGFAPSVETSTARAWQDIEAWLHGRAALRSGVTWLIDEFDAAAESPETDVERLIRLAERTGARCSVIVALQRPGLASRLADLSDFLVELTPWNHADSRRFIHAALASAEAPTALFTEDGLDALIDDADGLPSRLLRIAEVALIAGRVLEAEQLDAELIHAVT